jgi:hypothetical protein
MVSPLNSARRPHIGGKSIYPTGRGKAAALGRGKGGEGLGVGVKRQR